MDQVVATKEYLEKHKDIVHTLYDDERASQETITKGIGSGTISLFLGEKNWSKSKVADLLRMAEKLHPKIMKELMRPRAAR